MSMLLLRLFLILLASSQLIGGTSGSRSLSEPGYELISNSCIDEDSYQRDKLTTAKAFSKSKEKIINNHTNESQKISSLVVLYIGNKSLFETPQDYLSLLSCPPNKLFVKKAADDFLKIYLDDFFNKNPTIKEILSLSEEITFSLAIASEIRERALNFIKTPEEYLIFIKQNKSNSKSNKKNNAIVIRKSLELFKNTQPSPTIDQVMEVHKYILEIQIDLDTTIAALLKLKEVFLDDFTGLDRIRLLDYGCKNPAKSYSAQLKEFKKLHNLSDI